MSTKTDGGAARKVLVSDDEVDIGFHIARALLRLGRNNQEPGDMERALDDAIKSRGE